MTGWPDSWQADGVDNACLWQGIECYSVGGEDHIRFVHHLNVSIDGTLSR
jgi:hypothetical protein